MAKIKQAILSSLVVVISTSVLESAPVLAQPVTIKFGATGGRNDSQQVFQQRFQKELAARAPGRFTVELYPSGQLGSMPQMAQGLQFGTVEMVIMAPQHLRGIDPRFAVVEAPGLLKDVAHANRAYRQPDFHDAYLSSAKDKGLVGAAIYAEGPTLFITRAPVKQLDDFKGMKLRVLATDIEQRLASYIGATGVNVEWMEIPGALQRRQIDGVRTSLAIATAFKFFNAAKYVTYTQESIIPIATFVSARFLDKLPADMRSAVLGAVTATEAGMTEVAMGINDKAEATWKEGGGEILRLPAQQQDAFLKRAGQIGADAYRTADPQVHAMYVKLQQAAAATR